MLTNNHDSMMASVITLIQGFGLSMSEAQKGQLRYQLENPDKISDYFHVEFSHEFARASCDLHVRNDRFCGEHITDEDGSLWNKTSAHVEMSWPSHGSGNLEECSARLTMYNQVYALCTRLNKMLEGVDLYRMIQTAEQVKESKKKAEEHKIQRALQVVVATADLKHMRVGHDRCHLFSNEFSKLPEGSWSVEHHNKTYQITVQTLMDRAWIRRTA